MVDRTSSILGPDGNPIVIRTLGEEVATPTVAGVRRTHEERVASGITPERLGTILRDAAEGNARSYLTLAEEMEERYLHYASQLQTRRLAIESIDITVESEGVVTDPTGIQPDRMVNFSSDRRLKTTFWSNMNSARAAGQWERAQRSKKTLPYVLYLRTTSGDPRPEHLLWVGTILPIDHPFWKTHWPPNGWLCKCQVRMISAREAERLLGTERVYGKDADGNEIRIRYTDQVPDLGPDLEYRNRRTGEVSMVPPGIDPGWQTNPGLARASTLIQNLETKLAVADPGDAVRVLKDLWDDPYLKITPKLPEAVTLPAGHNAAVASELGASSPVISVGSDVLSGFVSAGAAAAELASLPDILSSGGTEAGPRAATRGIVGTIGSAIWRSIVSIAVNGLMRVEELEKIR